MVCPNKKVMTCVAEFVRIHPDAKLPTRAHGDSDSGWDLYSVEDLWIEPGRTALVGTGYKIALPHMWEGQVRPRSGLALKKSVTVVNTPGTVDSCYRGSLGVILINHGSMPFHVAKGDRIAQIVFMQIPPSEVKEVAAFSYEETIRGEGAYGSSGK